MCFKDNQGGTANERLDYETKVIANAKALDELGEDYRGYLKDHDIIKDDPWKAVFGDPADEEVEEAAPVQDGGQPVEA